MKLIQIFALVAALAVAAAAQSTSTNSQSSGSTTPAKTTSKTDPGKGAQNGATSSQPAVKLTVPKNKPAAAANKTSSSTSSTGTKKTTASKTGAQAAQTKTPAVVIKPVQKPASASTKATSTKGASGATAANKKTVPATTTKPAVKATVAKKNAPKKDKAQVKVIAKKNADKNTSASAETSKSGPAGRRDPFISIIRNAPQGPQGPSCSVGKKCLYIPELVLKGIAKDPEGQMLAVVMSNTHRAYFLRENDQVFNGSVEKITSDSVVFREYATDHLGRETAHEVVKRIPKT